MLNEDQKAATDWIVSNVLEGKEQFMTLIGAGGTGKTFCIMSAAERLLSAGLKVLFTAPTNKAVKQLEKSAREFGLSGDNVSFMTTHRALGLAMLPNEDRKFAVRAGKGFIEIFDVVVVDEASMLSKIALFKYLVPDCQVHKRILIGMGDDLQLPPVKERVSAIFSEFPSFRLEQNMRTSEGALLTINDMLRTAMMAGKPFKGPEPDGDRVVSVLEAKFLKFVVNEFDLETDLDKQRVLAWSNKRVDQVNDAIRAKLYGKNPPRFVVGERVVTGGPVKDPEGDITLGTDEECIVTHINENSSVYDEASGTEYRTIQLVLEPLYLAGQEIVEVLHESEQDRFEAQAEQMAIDAKASPQHSRQLWAKFWAFKELFSDIRYCYCTTVHRAQGVTLDRVFVDLKDILRNRNREERQRLVYVGFSRPRHQLIVNKRKYVA